MLKDNALTTDIINILRHQSTEKPGTKALDAYNRYSYFVCRGCGLALFQAADQFVSGTGWPSFDNAIGGTVRHLVDSDGHRTEIQCAQCQGHLGHVFYGEHMTAKNTRYCVNSLAIEPVAGPIQQADEIIIAGGCFWGIQHLMASQPGVVKTVTGYTGGVVANPDYQTVCQGHSGHLEAVRVLFDASVNDTISLYRLFFAIHDPTQKHGQGADIGSQYQSAIFYFDDQQRQIGAQLVGNLAQLGYDVVTKLRPVTVFWRAEEEHQHFYDKHPSMPRCHSYKPKF
jgi:peptide methionine sulfoxide reductase msrA/msrB